MPDMLRLPAERLEQLRRLSRNREETITQSVGWLIAQAIKIGDLADEMPGFTILAHKDVVIFALNEGEGVPSRLPAAVAAGLADSIDSVANGKLTTHLNIFGDTGLKVTRVGTGIKLELLTGETKVISRDVAKDVARLLRKAAATLAH